MKFCCHGIGQTHTPLKSTHKKYRVRVSAIFKVCELQNFHSFASRVINQINLFFLFWFFDVRFAQVWICIDVLSKPRREKKLVDLLKYNRFN